MTKWRGSFVAVLAALLPACTLLASLDGLSGGSPNGGGDAEASADSAPGDDGGGGADGAGGDGAGDAGDADARPSICGRRGSFCETFDDDAGGPDANFASWDEVIVHAPSVVELAASERSAPYALRARALASDGGDIPNVRLTKRVFGDPSGLEIEADIAPAQIGPTDGAAVILIGVEALNASQARVGNLNLMVTESGPKLHVKQATSAEGDELTALPAFPTTRKWVHVSIDASSGMVVVKYDGQQVAPPARLGWRPATQAKVSIGIVGGSGCRCSATDVWFDNFEVALR